MLNIATPNIYMARDLFPNISATTPIVTLFVAGPAVKNINALPRVIPFTIRDIAIGRDDVAQTYRGMEITKIDRYLNIRLSATRFKISLGNIVEKIAPIIRPISRGFDISLKIVLNA